MLYEVITLQTENRFDDVPIVGIKASRSLLENGGSNCVIIEAGKGEISTPSWARIEELSSLISSFDNTSSGRYHLYVLVKDYPETWNDPPNDTTTVLYVHLDTRHRWYGDTTFV